MKSPSISNNKTVSHPIFNIREQMLSIIVLEMYKELGVSLKDTLICHNLTLFELIRVAKLKFDTGYLINVASLYDDALRIEISHIRVHINGVYEVNIEALARNIYAEYVNNKSIPYFKEQAMPLLLWLCKYITSNRLKYSCKRRKVNIYPIFSEDKFTVEESVEILLIFNAI